MKLWHISIVGVVAALAWGCCTPKDEAVLFRRKHPEEARHYTVLEPTSLKAIMGIEYEHIGVIKGILRGIEKRMADPEELQRYLRSLECKVSRLETNWLADLRKIDALSREVGGRIYYYERYERTRTFGVADNVHTIYGTGFIVLRGGEMVYSDRLNPEE